MQHSTRIARFILEDQKLYGNARLGTKKIDKELFSEEFAGALGTDIWDYNGTSAGHVSKPAPGNRGQQVRGEVRYELTDHLGNVRSVITDRKLPTQNGGAVDYAPDVVSAQDYYPFGSLMPDRQYANTSFASNGYRFGFNGMERDDEVSGGGNSYNLGLRQYDARIGRMFSIDPRTLEYPWQTPYAYHRNSPISMIDYLGGGDPPTGNGREFRDIKTDKDGQSYFWNGEFWSNTVNEGVSTIVGIQTFDRDSYDLAWRPSSDLHINLPHIPRIATEAEARIMRRREIAMNASGDPSKIRYLLNKDYELGKQALKYRRDNHPLREATYQFGMFAATAPGYLELGSALWFGRGGVSVLSSSYSVWRSGATVANNTANLVGALNRVGGSRAVSEFLGWGNKTTILKSASDFTKQQLIKAGYTKQVLTEIHSGLMSAAKKTLPSTGQLNPASMARAKQIQEILIMHFK